MGSLAFIASSVPPLAMTFAGVAALALVLGVTRLLMQVEVVTVFGRRSKAAVRYVYRKAFARQTFNELCANVAAAQRKLARGGRRRRRPCRPRSCRRRSTGHLLPEILHHAVDLVGRGSVDLAGSFSEMPLGEQRGFVGGRNVAAQGEGRCKELVRPLRRNVIGLIVHLDVGRQQRTKCQLELLWLLARTRRC